MPYCQPSARQRHSPPVHAPFKFSPEPRSEHFSHHCPAWYRWRTSFSSLPGNLPHSILARTPELCLHQIAASHGSDRLLGNQICHWTTGTSETCLKVTHLVVFLPPALGAYVLSQHRTKVSSSLSSADDVSTPDELHTLRINQSSLLTPPAVIKHQVEQIANARRRAAEGSLAPYTIPLLANTQTRSSKNRVTETLKFTLPAPAEEGTTRRFSAVPRGYGPSGAHALKGRCVVHTPSITNMKPPHFSLTLTSSPCLIMSPNMAPFGLKLLGLCIPDSIKEWLLSGAPRIYDRKDLELPGNRQIAFPSILTRYFCSELTIQQFEVLLIAKEADNDKELHVAATACRKMKRTKQTLARLRHSDASSTITSAPASSSSSGHLRPAYRILAVVALLLQILVLLACILAPINWAILFLRASGIPCSPSSHSLSPGPKTPLFSRLHRKQVRTLP